MHVESPAHQAAVIVLGNTGYIDEMRPVLDERACGSENRSITE